MYERKRFQLREVNKEKYAKKLFFGTNFVDEMQILGEFPRQLALAVFGLVSAKKQTKQSKKTNAKRKTG